MFFRLSIDRAERIWEDVVDRCDIQVPLAHQTEELLRFNGAWLDWEILLSPDCRTVNVSSGYLKLVQATDIT
jgi:hypothetical protein